MKKIPDGSFVAITDGSRIMIVQHAYGKKNWSLPGGGVDEGETFEEAALRECKEETGHTPNKMTLVAKFQSQKFVGQYTHLFIADLLQNKKYKPKNKSEIENIYTPSLTGAEQLLTMQAQKRFLATLRAYLENPDRNSPYEEWLSGQFRNRDIEKCFHQIS